MTKPQLNLTNVEVSFNGFRALNGFDFSVNKGELRCLIGPNGAGKTTALDVICGKTKLTAGDVEFESRSIRRLQEHQIARIGIGRKFQIPSVFHELTVHENMEVASSQETSVLKNLCRFNSTKREDLDELAELVNLQDHMNTNAGHLSHGQTQWLEIALLVAQNPKLILMDEPTAGMTRQETHKTAELFLQLKNKHTLIVVEHDMGFVKEIGDVISVMHQGKLLAEGSVKDIENNREVIEAYLGKGGIAYA
jgi:urea transport system ATP-binding protein